VRVDDEPHPHCEILPSESWRAVEPVATELLSVTQREGADGARRWLDEPVSTCYLTGRGLDQVGAGLITRRGGGRNRCLSWRWLDQVLKNEWVRVGDVVFI
jgi:hypothetical protein